MTGGRALSCVFCRILHVIEINRRNSYVTGLRVPAGAACINTKRTITSSPWLQDSNKDADKGSESSSSSSSDDENSSNSSSSDSDSEVKTVKSSQKSDEKGLDMFSMLREMKASEERWGSQHNVETNLKKIEHSIDKELVTEAIELSKKLPGEPGESEHDLISQLLGQFETTANQKQGAAPATKPPIVEDIQESPEIQKAIKMRKAEEKKMPQEPDISTILGSLNISPSLGKDEEKDVKRLRFRQPSKLFQGKPLGIFKPKDMKSAKPEKRSLFDEVEEEERNEMNFYPPSNAFEEQIQWTREGKLWTFPIDNEAGWEEEMNVEFYEHVFLDDQLLDFPKKGPIRHFMELVTIALSKNPYLTVTQKREHIDWYREYFKSKYDILEPRLGKDGVIQSQA
ncbi:small ribosomal subunit protein mS31-like isoform X1 [Ruditapes philippinarum]|uniref:small ribosomal subunit protein mS31-like isoform X1 n=1 Tax=Ruditapes philippinarum TaxID=129788 RepID=UPI00295A7AC1|nr:small ribosomal subunit protein mS31-like isoform X1 [Ruditapes philippinarum]